MSKAVLSYSEFIAEKVDQNLSDVNKVGKGKSNSKQVDQDLADLPKATGKNPKSEVDPELAALPKGGKTSTTTVKSNLSNLNKGTKAKAATADIDPKFAKTPSAIKK